MIYNLEIRRPDLGIVLAETEVFDEKRVRQAEALARRKAEAEIAHLKALLEKLQKPDE
jgi:hypothetical protein